ncbi:MAG TPA: hypothetical protein VMG12_37145 [Polyangiaceae bacterium]|nr:hypothetical protein [Polyangiaceae bacterium]
MNTHRIGSYLRGSSLMLLGCSSLALLAVACGGDDPTIINAPPAGGTGGSSGQTSSAGTGGSGGSPASGGTGGTAGTAGTGGSGGTSGDAAEEHISGEIDADATWSADTTYILDDVTYVVNDATLTIEPGTTIKGGGVGSALIVTRGSRLVAEGTAADPIVFTSAVEEGLRAPGDWGGVALLGAAPVNVEGPQLEGIEVVGDEERGSYGGTDEAHDCGSLEYVRIEFAGFEISADNELNGLTLAGCGTGTNIDYVQVHRGSDDGIEVFGGKADIKHAVLTNIQDDSLDWDFGWTGRAQFLVIRHDAATSDAGFEADNGNPSTEVTPRSQPNIFNVTLVGGEGSASPGMVLRRGTWGAIHNAIVTGFPVSGVDIRDAFSVDGTETDPPSLLIANSIFFENGSEGTEHADADGAGDDDDDEGFDEAAYLAREDFANRLSVDPELPDATNVTAPNLVPPATSPAATGGATPPEGFDVSATYVGALPPGGPDWTAGWTSYPED